MCVCVLCECLDFDGHNKRSRGLQVTQASASPSTRLDIRARQTSARRRLRQAGGGRGGHQDKRRLCVVLGKSFDVML